MSVSELKYMIPETERFDFSQLVPMLYDPDKHDDLIQLVGLTDKYGYNFLLWACFTKMEF